MFKTMSVEQIDDLNGLLCDHADTLTAFYDEGLNTGFDNGFKKGLAIALGVGIGCITTTVVNIIKSEPKKS